MLFRDFFPRLQDRALARYNISLSARQFTNWREKGLVPGPAHPRGRGRGLSPDRHWPVQAYRRALRICRYKSLGIEHVPAWWVLLWLSGEDVPLDALRSSLRRELKRVRRQSRYLAESGYLRSGGSTTLQKAPAAPERRPLSALTDQIIESPHLGIEPELYRDFLGLEFNQESSTEVSRVFQAMISPLMGHDVTPEEVGVSLAEVWRPGYLSEDEYDYVAKCRETDLVLARRILWESARLERHVAPFAHLLGASRPASILFVLAFTTNKSRLGSRAAIDAVLRQLYQIVRDRRAGLNPDRRLEFYLESLRMMKGAETGVVDQADFIAALDTVREKGFQSAPQII